MKPVMRKLDLVPYVKYVVLKVDLLLEAEIIDEPPKYAGESGYTEVI